MKGEGEETKKKNRQKKKLLKSKYGQKIGENRKSGDEQRKRRKRKKDRQNQNIQSGEIHNKTIWR